jgi:hypothetical protein
VKPAEVLQSVGGVGRWEALKAAGVTERALAKAVAAGEIRKVAYGTYALRRAHPFVVAAVQSNGYLWRESAAEFWGLDVRHPPTVPHIVVPGGRKRTQATGPQPDHAPRGGLFTERIPWPVTSVAQTLIDCARTLPYADALVVLDSALRSDRISELDVAALAASFSGRGAASVRRVLAAGDARSASIGETLVRASALEAGLPGPDLQHKVEFDDGSVAYLDLAWPEYRGRPVKLDVEFDGYSGHGKVDFVSDRRRNNKLVMAGWIRLIYTMPDVERRYLDIGQEIRTVLDARSRQVSFRRLRR